MADWKEQVLRFWQNMERRQRLILIGVGILTLVAVLGVSYWVGSRPDLVPLYTGLEAKDAGAIREKLKELKIPHEVGGDGTVILVSSKDVYRVRLDLASQGLPRGNKGFEIFDQSKFGTTEFQNKVNLLQALQGELTRTIEQMAEVEKARVHIVMPEDSLYKKNEKPATASIMLKLKPQTELSKEQIKGIVNLVAHSIQGLKPENVTVVDSMARVLNEPPEQPGGIGAGSLTQVELTKKMQEEMQKNLQSLLDQVLGPGKAAARVNLELTFDQRTVDKQTFEPVVDDKGIVRSSQDVSENYKGTSTTPGGPAGTPSNIPGYVTTNPNSQSNYEKKEAVRNYEINETKDKVVAAPGSIRRLAVAVLVDESVTPLQQDSLSRTVSSAVGINQTRGDVLSVERLPFSTELADKQKQEEEDFKRQQAQAMWMKIGLVLLLAGTLFAIIRLYLKRKQREREMEEMQQMLAMDEAADMVGAEAELSPEERRRQEQRQAIEQMAKARPEDIAQMLKAWLTDE